MPEEPDAVGSRDIPIGGNGSEKGTSLVPSSPDSESSFSEVPGESAAKGVDFDGNS